MLQFVWWTFTVLFLTKCLPIGILAEESTTNVPTTDFMETKVLFNENVPCPRDCICAKSGGIANCRTLELKTQTFGKNINQIVVHDIDSSHPIILEAKMFKKLGLEDLISVRIINTTIQSIDKTAFDGLKHLEAVELINNNLTWIHPDLFIQNVELNSIKLDNNPIEVLDKQLLNNHVVTELIITNGRIKSLNSEMFSNMSNLNFINLSGNKIHEIEENTFKGIPMLDEIDLSYNELKTFPPTLFADNEELFTLRLNGNPLKVLPELKTKDLKTLEVSGCHIETVSQSMFSGVSSIENLYLNSNGIKRIEPGAFKKLIALQYIDLSENKLTSLTKNTFYDNFDLYGINLSHNPGLIELPLGGFNSILVEGFTSLGSLDLSYCGLEHIDKNAFSSMPSLTKILLNNNAIKTVHAKAFSNLKSLLRLDLSNNEITKLGSATFDNNKHLTQLQLAENPLETVTLLLFKNTPKLLSLDIHSCKLSKLWEMPENTEGYLKSLTFLNASMNNIVSVKHDDVKMLVKLKTMDITGNPLHCNKDLRDFIAWLGEHGVSPDGPDPTHMEYYGASQHVESTMETVNRWESLAKNHCPPMTEETPVPRGVLQNNTEHSLLDVLHKNPWKSWDTVDDDLPDRDPEDGAEYLDENEDDKSDSDSYDDNYDDEDIDDDDEDDEENETDNNNNYKTVVPDNDIEVMPIQQNNDIKFYNYMNVSIVVFLGIVVLAIILRLIIKRRRAQTMRYNSVIISAMSSNKTKKDCGLVYKQLSEDLTGPATPVFNRFSTPTVHNTYNSSLYHHSRIMPEAENV